MRHHYRRFVDFLRGFDSEHHPDDDDDEALDLRELLHISGGTAPGLQDRGVYHIAGHLHDGSLRRINEDIILKQLSTTWTDDIQLIVNSPGGLSCEGWPLVDILDWIRMDVRTVGMGDIASFGTMIVAAGTPGKRFVTPNTSIMVHNFYGGVDGKYTDIVANMKQMHDEHHRAVRFWTQHSKYNTVEEVMEHLLKSEDVHLTPEEALTHGIIDGIAGKHVKI